MPLQTIHVFCAHPDTFGYTLDPSGADLPEELAATDWRHVGTIPGGDGTESHEVQAVRAAIARDGVYIIGDSVGIRAHEFRPDRPPPRAS